MYIYICIFVLIQEFLEHISLYHILANLLKVGGILYRLDVAYYAVMYKYTRKKEKFILTFIKNTFFFFSFPPTI